MTVPLRQRLEDYLALRRALGFRLVRQGALLAQFVSFAETAGSQVVTVELALAWARQPKGANPTWVSRRLERGARVLPPPGRSRPDKRGHRR